MLERTKLAVVTWVCYSSVMARVMRAVSWRVLWHGIDSHLCWVLQTEKPWFVGTCPCLKLSEKVLCYFYIYKLVCIWVGINIVVVFIVIEQHQAVWKEKWVFALVYLLKGMGREISAFQDLHMWECKIWNVRRLGLGFKFCYLEKKFLFRLGF